MDDRKMTFIKEVYDTIRKMMINEQIAVYSRYILDADREARDFWALMPTSGVYHPIFCYVDQTDDRHHFIRFCIGINYRSNRNLNGLMRDYPITLSPSLDDKYYCIADTSDSCVYLTADALIGDACPTEADVTPTSKQKSDNKRRKIYENRKILRRYCLQADRGGMLLSSGSAEERLLVIPQGPHRRW